MLGMLGHERQRNIFHITHPYQGGRGMWMGLCRPPGYTWQVLCNSSFSIPSHFYWTQVWSLSYLSLTMNWLINEPAEQFNCNTIMATLGSDVLLAMLQHNVHIYLQNQFHSHHIGQYSAGSNLSSQAKRGTPFQDQARWSDRLINLSKISLQYYIIHE